MSFGYKNRIKILVSVALCLMLFVVRSDAQEGVMLKEVVVISDQEQVRNLPLVDGTRIYSGKKTSVIDLEVTPQIINNNYRQALQKSSGLLLSEESTPLLSLGYRGLDPHRAQFTQILKDGIPIHADMFGYPEAYYTPPLQTIERIDFIKGGGALLYGPQPGGVLNFVSKEPYEDVPLTFEFENSVGSYDLFSNYMGLGGTQGSLGYSGYFHHRESQGFRDNNSQVDLYSGGTKFKIWQDEHTAWRVALDVYQEEHGEPGGLTRTDFDLNPRKTNRLNDHFELNRYAAAVSLEKKIDQHHLLEVKTFGGYYQRLSWRQRTSVSNFGMAPGGINSLTNDIENQEFFTGGSETRFRKDYEGFDSQDNTLTAGVLFYHVTSPRVDKRGTAPDATDGMIRKDSDRTLNYVSVFAENLFKFGKLSITPGVRVENIWQSVKENTNLDKTTVPLGEDSRFDFVPLLGLGVVYELPVDMEMYGNISQGYRPKIYTQAVPTGSGQVVNHDLKEGKSWQTDMGFRGAPIDYFSWDVGYFYMEFSDQIGTSGMTVDNVGDSRHQGIELTGEFNVIGWLDRVYQTDYNKRLGAINVFANTMVLQAEFIKGENKGKTPRYAPDFIFKTGIEYDRFSKVKVRLAGTFVDDHFANDTNTAQFVVPSYKVWDLTGEVNVYKDAVSLLGGINNIFDEHYFSRVRNDGIDPAAGRNYYMGVKMIW